MSDIRMSGPGRKRKDKPVENVPISTQFDDEPPLKESRTDEPVRTRITGLTVKRIPRGALIGTNTEGDIDRVKGIGFPTKNNRKRLVMFDIEADGRAVKRPAIDVDEFPDQFDRVLKTNTPVSLDKVDNSVSMSRLSANVQVIKDKKTDENTDKGDDDDGPPPLEPVQETTGSSVENKAVPDTSDGPPEEPPSTSEVQEMENKQKEQSIKALSGDVSETPPKESAKDASLVEKGPVGTVEPLGKSDKRDVEVSDGIPSQESIRLEELNMWKSLMDAAVQSKDIDTIKMINQARRDIVNELEQLKKGDAPPGVAKAQEEELALRGEEDVRQANDTKEKTDDVEMAKDAPETLLSGNQLGGVVPADHVTGGRNDVILEHQLSPEEVRKSKPSAMAEQDDVRDPNAAQLDMEVSDTNQATRVPLSVEAGEMELIDPNTNTNGTASSANAMRILEGLTEKKMEVITGAETKKQDAMDKRLQEEEHRQLKEAFGQGALRQQQQQEEQETQFGQVQQELRETTRARASNLQERQRQEQQRQTEQSTRTELLGRIETEGGGSIEGFNQLMSTLVEQGLLASAASDINTTAEARESLRIRSRILAQLRQENKVRNVQTATAPTPQEVLNISLREQARGLGSFGIQGTSGVGTPVFAPDTSRSELHRLQIQEVATLTAEEAHMNQKDMEPLWIEFRGIRTHQGVLEMEAMPTRVITSDRSRLKAASKVRNDVDQREESFGYFMFWLLHHKWDTSKAVTWRRMLLYSASLGYNDLTEAQINWLVTGNPNGDLDEQVDFTGILDNIDDAIPLVSGKFIRKHTIDSLHAQIKEIPEPSVEYPSRSVSPSATPRDASTHPNGSKGPDRVASDTLRGLPSGVRNIADPRFSKRGGVDVHNVRVVTISNPDYDPSKNPGDKGYKPPFVTKEVPDIGVGSKDVGAKLAQADADRLLDSVPVKLYAPIHPQPCDRYLGARNYRRLGLELADYLPKYSQQGFQAEDKTSMYNWNVYVMALYGPMLYAFVTDINLQRSTPVFDLSTPEAVGDEFMELNELIDVLQDYQRESVDRSERVADGGVSAKPLEEHLDKFFQDQRDEDRERLFDPNAVVIGFPDSSFPAGGDTGDSGGGDDRPGVPPDPPTPIPVDPVKPPEVASTPETSQAVFDAKRTPIDMDRGVSRNDTGSNHMLYHHADRTNSASKLLQGVGGRSGKARMQTERSTHVPDASDLERRNRLFHLMSRR